ncbi:MAG TPA: SRPBCC family protein [Egibacteraceae bacterium]|nr:SRPBCC family protein [Egibacteraceae bacterium]
MPSVDGGIVIGRPVSEVFAYATSAESHLRWVPGLADAAYLDPGPLGVGSRWRATVRFGGLTLDTVNEVTEFVADHRFAWRSVQSPVRSSGSYRFTRLGPLATRFDYAVVSDDRLAALVGAFAMPVAMRLLRREIRSRLEALKVCLEAGDFRVA